MKDNGIIRVLVVDDDEGIRDTLRIVLEDAGYEVLEAADGLAALDLLRASRQRLIVLLDMMMPRLDGAGVLGTVAGDHGLSHRNAYVMLTATSHTLSLAFANLLTNLSVPVVRKPFDVDKLLDTVSQAAQRLHA